jgi:hypothetical protein
VNEIRDDSAEFLADRDPRREVSSTPSARVDAASRSPESGVPAPAARLTALRARGVGEGEGEGEGEGGAGRPVAALLPDAWAQLSRNVTISDSGARGMGGWGACGSA